MKVLVILFRTVAAITGGCVTLLLEWRISVYVIRFASAHFPPQIGYPSTDPHGRGSTTAAAVFDNDLFLALILAAVGGWLVWLLTNRKNWSVDLLVAAPVFLVFAGICEANYTYQDEVFTRDAQAALNIPFAISGLVVVVLLQRTLQNSHHLIATLLGSAVLAFCIYAFVAVPLWYSLSYLSWREGAGELKSLDDVAKAIAAALSIAAVLGVQWKNGSLAMLRGSP